MQNILPSLISIAIGGFFGLLISWFLMPKRFLNAMQKWGFKKVRKTMIVSGESGTGRTMFIMPEMALFRPYYLEGKEAIPVAPLLVKQTDPLPGVKVVTHFTGLDYSREGKLFCTHLESDTDPCSLKAATWDEALQQHEEMILKAFEV